MFSPRRLFHTLRNMADNSELLQQVQLLKKLFDDGLIAQDALAAFRLTKKLELAALLPKIKGEMAKYNKLASTIKPRSERLDKETGKGTFNLLAWWRANMAELASWVPVLRGILAHSPNSCPPERVFSILNDSFDDDQKNALADYMEFSLMVHYNERDERRRR